MNYFLVCCPHCSHDQKYHAPTKILGDKRKACVYCGKSFKLCDHLVREL